MDPVTISMLFSAGVSAYQAYKSSADAKKANESASRIGAQLRAVREADRVSGVQVPQMGAELAKQSIGQQTVSSINALAGAGAAGVLGGVPGIAAVNNEAILDIAAQQDRMQAQRDQFVAGQLQAIEGRDVKSQRELLGDQLLGAQMESYAQRQAQQQAISTGVNALGKGLAAEIGAQKLFDPKAPIIADVNSSAFTQPSITAQNQISFAPPIEGRLDQSANMYQAGYNMAPPGLVNKGNPQDYYFRSLGIQ
jgi:hypothetical protein